MKENEVVLFEARDNSVSLPVAMDGETVWLNRNQIAELFERDVKTIGKHIGNALKEELNDGLSTVAKFAIVQKEGGRTVTRNVEHYNLDVIISIGYRVKSNRGVEFRRWANSVLKEYIIKGYTINDKRLEQLNTAIKIMKHSQELLDTQQVISVIEQYNTALTILDDYTLVALTIMIAESRPEEKEIMIDIIMKCIGRAAR
jgi:Virulence protein